MRLTDIRLKALAPPEKGAKVYYCDSLQGFGVRVSQGGTKAFILATGKNRDRVTIGRYPIVGLAEAREVAKNLLAERQLGRHQTPTISLGAAIDLFTEQHVANLAPRTQSELTRLFVRYLPKLRTKKLAEITTHDITAITDKAAPSEGEHFHRACKTFFRWCVRRRLLQHSPLEGLELPSKWKPRERVLTDDELRAVWGAADAVEGYGGIIVKLLILTGQRRGEISSLRSEWITGINEPHLNPKYTHSENIHCGVAQLVEHSAVNRVVAGSSPAAAAICLPATITKNERSHTFPIGFIAASVLRSSKTTQEGAPSTAFLFPARGGSGKSFNGWSKAKGQLDKTISSLSAKNEQVNAAPVQPWTLHDLRRTYATNLQRLGIRLEVIEALLNHVSGTRAGIVGVYNRHRYETEMREAVTIFDEWFAKAILAE
jgi:integrase